MTETGEKIEKLGNSVNNMLAFLKKNANFIRKKYTYNDIIYIGSLRIKIWLVSNNLSLRVVNDKNKRVELYVTNCKTLAVRFKMR